MSKGSVVVQTAEGWRLVTKPDEIARVKREGCAIKAPKALYMLPNPSSKAR